MTPGVCKAKSHKREYLGYGGRRTVGSMVVSREWQECVGRAAFPSGAGAYAT
jgi:hypothetical protein